MCCGRLGDRRRTQEPSGEWRRLSTASSLARDRARCASSDARGLVGVGITGFCGQWGVTYAFRHGEVSAVAPFEYTSLVWTLGLDRLIWHTVPDGYTLLGAAIIIAAGLFLVRRERVHAEAEHP
jgi:hypothetical protein